MALQKQKMHRKFHRIEFKTTPIINFYNLIVIILNFFKYFKLMNLISIYHPKVIL